VASPQPNRVARLKRILRLFPILATLALTGLASSEAAPTAPAAAVAEAAAADRVEPAAISRWVPHVNAARRYAKKRTGEVSFVVQTGRRRWGYNKDMTAQTASVIKVMFLAAYLRRPGVRDRRLSNRERRLLGPMIRRSDNDAASEVSLILGPGPLKRLARRARMRDFAYTSPWGASRTSAPDQAHFMRNLRRYIPERHWGYARRLLSSIVPAQRWGVGRAEPPGWEVYFKGGWGLPPPNYGGLDHQVALLQHGRHRIGLAILTQGNPVRQYGDRTLEGVARRLLRGLPNP